MWYGYPDPLAGGTCNIAPQASGLANRRVATNSPIFGGRPLVRDIAVPFVSQLDSSTWNWPVIWATAVASGAMLLFFIFTMRKDARTATATGSKGPRSDARPSSSGPKNPVEILFKAAYPESEHALVIARWMKSKRCSRFDAMRFAVEEWRAEQAKAIPMPDLSSPNSKPYIPPSQRDGSAKRSVDEGGASALAAQSRSYDESERDFNLVFAIKSRVDKEHMIAHWRKFHGGSREAAMKALVDEWRRDNRSWR